MQMMSSLASVLDVGEVFIEALQIQQLTLLLREVK